MKYFVAFLCVLITPLSFAENKTQNWDYKNPSLWGEIPDFKTCKTGKEQSPINIQIAHVKKIIAPLEINYQASRAEVINNGHTIQVNLNNGGSFSVNHQAYELVQFHFHTPSEEKINGQQYPMVAHLVHKNPEGHLAVIALLMKEGKENKALKEIFEHLPAHQDINKELNHEFNTKILLPERLNYFGFHGSLTTPPCSEGVLWHVIKQPIELSKTQIQSFKSVVKSNARPVQALNGRSVQESN
jgi:carbonic anhydrase